MSQFQAASTTPATGSSIFDYKRRSRSRGGRSRSRSRSRSAAGKRNPQAKCVGRRLRSGANKTLAAASRSCSRSRSRSRSSSRSRRSRSRSARRRSRRSRSRSGRRHSRSYRYEPVAAPVTTSGQGAWQNYVRQYADAQGVTYGEAMRLASPAWKQAQGQ